MRHVTSRDRAELRRLESVLKETAARLSNAESEVAKILSRYRVHVDPSRASTPAWELQGRVKQVNELFETL